MKSDPFILSHIAAASTNNVIGLNNKLPWHIPEDLRFFQIKTEGAAVIMGRKTFESLGSPLPRRLNIIISRNKTFELPSECLLFSSIDSAVNRAKKQSSKKEIFIIGGAEIYQKSLLKVHKIYLTRIHKSFHGDAFYPEIPKNKFQLIEKEDRKGPPPFSFLTYVSKSFDYKSLV